jgi:hypothetical protein
MLCTDLPMLNILNQLPWKLGVGPGHQYILKLTSDSQCAAMLLMEKLFSNLGSVGAILWVSVQRL